MSLASLRPENYKLLSRNRTQHENDPTTREIKAGSLIKVQTFLPSEGRAIGGVVRVRHGEPEEDVAVGFVLLDVDCVVSLREYRRVVIDILDVDVEQNTRRARW